MACTKRKNRQIRSTARRKAKKSGCVSASDMRDYAKTGGRPGRPAYRTPSSFRYKKYREVLKMNINMPGSEISTAAKGRNSKAGKVSKFKNS